MADRTTNSDHIASNSNLIAAIDLGSNSFHMLLAVPREETFDVVETLKEKVQLLSGCRDGVIQEAAFARARACLHRFRQRLAAVAPEHIYIRGTHALRQAVNAENFLEEINDILDARAVVVSGEEEARLVYQAVACGTALEAPDKTVIDVGGGSTEIAQGSGADVLLSASLPVGCVSLTDRYVQPLGQSAGFLAAKEAVMEALGELKRKHPEVITQCSKGVVVGTSGTLESVHTVMKSNGWTADRITVEGVRQLEDAIVEEHWFVEAGLPGLSPDRIDIFTAGAAIVCACFAALELSELHYSDVSLQHGLLFDIIGTGRDAIDNAEDSIAHLASLFAVDKPQADRVRRQCMHLYEQTQLWWGGDEVYRRLLDWAARLHEVGRRVNGSHYHRHGSYLIKHCRLQGVSDAEQTILALMVRGHRRSLPRLAFQAFDPALANALTRLVSLLRVAVILERSHSEADSPAYEVLCDDDALELVFEDQWLREHPLSSNELVIEAAQLAESGLRLGFRDARD